MYKINPHINKQAWIVLDEIWYKWIGATSEIFWSYEYGRRFGEIRMIADVPFFVVRISYRRWYQKPQVCWGVRWEHRSPEFVNKLKKALFIL